MAFAATGVSDEHALAHLWNYATKHPKHDLHKEIDKARHDPKHPLHISQFPKAGFVGGHHIGKEDAHQRELKNAASAVHAMRNHSSLKKAFEKGHNAIVTGSGTGHLSHLWHKHGAGNVTSKADVVLHPKDKPDHHEYGLSLKKGQAQLMSAHHSEFAATVDAATNHKSFSKHKKAIMDKVHHMGKLAHDFDKQSEGTQTKRLAQIQKMHGELHKKHPTLIQHIAREAATGHQKFEGTHGKATHMITTHGEHAASIHDLSDEKHPFTVKSRVSLKNHGSGGKTDAQGNKIRGKRHVSYRLDVY